MSPSARRTPRLRSTPVPPSSRPTHASFENMTVLGLNNSQLRVEQLPLRHDDNVKAGRDLVSTENLSYQSFSSIPSDRAAQFLRRRNPKAAHATRVHQDEERAIPTGDANAPLVYQPEIGVASDSFVGPEGMTGSCVLRRPGHTRLFAADRQTFAAFGTAALEHQSAVLRAHPHQKPVRPLAAARVGLERALSLHEIPSAWNEPSM